jgi:hypothetical protein
MNNKRSAQEQLATVAEKLESWKDRSVCFLTRGMGFTDAELCTIDSVFFTEDDEIYQCEYGFHSDMLFMIYIGDSKLCGSARSLVRAEVEGSVVTFQFKKEPVHTIALLHDA